MLTTSFIMAFAGGSHATQAGAAGGGGGFSYRHRLLAGAALAPAGALLISGIAMANPQGGKVVAGNVNIGAGGSTLTVTQTSNRAIVNWNSFSIAAGETAKFVLPSSTAAVLNRVTGDQLSALLGNLYSNGQVYLLNPNGVLIGPNGRVNTAGFVASTLDVSDQQFMQGGAVTLQGGSTAGVVVLGSVTANDGDVLLVAAQVDNQGTLIAPNGQAILAAGSEVLYVPGEYANIAVAAPAPASGAAISNTGLIKAASAQLAAAGTAYQLAVNNGGQISATAVGMVGGHVVLQAGDGDIVDSGAIGAKAGGAGGTVDLGGGRVALTGTASVDVSAPSGGGGVTLAASNAISVASGATLNANATVKGNGGKISVKAATITRFAGAASATGGPRGGDGGQAEISGASLLYSGSVDLSAPAGSTGALLFDPDEITIVSGNAAAPSGISGGLWGFTQNSGAQTISVGAIESLLGTANLELQATTSLTVAAPIAGAYASIASNTTNTLTLTSPTIAINAPISLPKGTLVLGWPASAVGSYGYPQSLTSSASATITAKAVQVAADYGTLTLSGAVVTPSLQFTEPTSDMAVTIANPANAIQAVSFDPSNSGNAAQSVDIETSGALTVSGNLQMQFNSVLLAAGDLTLAAGTVLQGGPVLSLVSTNGVFVNQAGAGAVSLGNGQVLIYSATNGTGASGTAFNDGGIAAAAELAQNYGTASGVTYPSSPNSIDTVVEYFATTSTKPVLTITANSFTRTYGQADPTFTASYSGGSGGGASELTTLPSFRISQGSDLNAGTYTIQPYGAASSADLLNYVDGLLTVNPAVLTVTANNASMTYGGTAPTLTYGVSGLVNGDSSSIVSGVRFSPTPTSSTGAGNYTLTPSGATVATPLDGTEPNYTVSYQSGTLTVNPAALSVSAVAASTSYGSAIPTLHLQFSGFVNQSDANSVPAEFVPVVGAVQGSGAGTYAITLQTLNPNSDYSVTYTGANLTINPVSLTITPNITSTYGAAVPTTLPAADYSGFVNGDTPSSLTTLPTLNTAATSSSPAGNYSVTASGAADRNYTITYDPGTLTIDRASLTITANSVSRVYGSSNPSLTVSYAGLVNGDSGGVVSGLTVTTAATSGSNVGTYAITASGASAANYTISYDPGVLTVTPAPLTITANSVSRVYGAANPEFTATDSGLVNGDSSFVVSGLTATTTATSTSNAGTYAITLAGASATNYSITYVPGVLTVTPAPLTVTATAASAVYGSALPTLQLTYSGFIDQSDAASVPSLYTAATSATQGAAVGAYPITLANPNADPDYTVSFVGANLTINPAPLVITPNLPNIAAGQAIPGVNTALPAADYSGFVNGDTPQSLSTQPGVFVAATSSSPGTYTVTAKGAVDPNYAISYQPGTLTIMQAALSTSVSTTSTLITTNTNSNNNIGNLNYTPTNSTISQNIPTPNQQLNVSQALLNGLGLFGTGQGLAIVTDFVTTANAAGGNFTVAQVESELNDPTVMAALMPFIMQDVSNILALPAGPCNSGQTCRTADQENFLQQVEAFIQSQRQAAAIQAENDYTTWYNQQVQNEVNELQTLPPGVAQVELQSIMSGNPPIPDPTMLQEASLGMYMNSSQTTTFSKIISATNGIDQMASAAQLNPSSLDGYIAGTVGDASTAISIAASTARQLAGVQGAAGGYSIIKAISPNLAKTIFPFTRATNMMSAARDARAAQIGAEATEAAEEASEATEDVTRGLEIFGDIASTAETAGQLVEVGANIIQTVVAIGEYSAISVYNTSFNKAIAADNAPVTDATLSAMLSSSSGTQSLYGYLEGFMATGGNTPLIQSTALPASTFESQNL